MKFKNAMMLLSIMNLFTNSRKNSKTYRRFVQIKLLEKETTKSKRMFLFVGRYEAVKMQNKNLFNL